MSAVAWTGDKSNNPAKLEFQRKCDLFSKCCVVFLAFAIPVSTFATHITLFALIVSWFLAGNLETKVKRISSHPVVKAMVALFVVFLVGAFYSPAPTSDIIQLLNKIAKLLYLPFVLSVMTEEKWRRRTLRAFLGAIVLTFALAVLKVYGGLPVTNNFTLACVFKDHIYTNLMMAFASFMVGHYLWRTTNKMQRFALGSLLLGLFFYVLCMSEGRSGHMIFLALWVLFCFQKFSSKRLWIVGLGSVFLGVIALEYSPMLQYRFFSIVEEFWRYQTSHFLTSVGQRLEFLNHTLQLVKEHPWVGYGTGSFAIVYHSYADLHHIVATDNPHNEYLNVLIQVGGLGLLVFLSLFVIIFKSSRELPEPEKWFVQGLIVAMMLGCVANSWLMDFTSGYFFVVLLAVCLAAHHPSQLEARFQT